MTFHIRYIYFHPSRITSHVHYIKIKERGCEFRHTKKEARAS